MLVDELEAQSQMHKLGILKSSLEGNSGPTDPATDNQGSDTLQAKVMLGCHVAGLICTFQGEALRTQIKKLQKELQSLQVRTKHIQHPDEPDPEAALIDVTGGVLAKLSEAADERNSLKLTQSNAQGVECVRCSSQLALSQLTGNR